MVKLPSPDEKKFDRCLERCLEDTFKRGYNIADTFEEPVSEEELEMIFDGWYQTDWWAYSVLPDFRDIASECLYEAMGIESPEQVGAEDWEEVDYVVKEEYGETISETVMDLISKLEEGVVEGLRDRDMLVEEG